MSTVTGVAEIEARLSGIEGVLSGLKQAETGVDGVAQKGSKAEAAFRGVGGALAGVVKSGLVAAGVFQSINIAKAVDDAKRLDETTARLGQAAGVAGATLKSQFEGMEQKALVAAPALAAMATQLARLTHDSQFAKDEVGSLATIAQSLGQSFDEQGGFAAALHDGLGISKDLAGEWDRMSGIAKQMGIAPTAFKDSLVSLAPQLENVSMETDEARVKVLSFVALLEKDLKPGQARRAAAGVLQGIESNWMNLEQRLGMQVLNKKGQVEDPAAVGKAYLDYVKRSSRSEAEVRRKVLGGIFGREGGAAVLRGDWKALEQLNQQPKDTGATEKGAAQYRNTDPAQRQARDLAKESAERDAGGLFNQAGDWMLQTLGAKGTIGASLIAGGLSSAGLWAGGKAALGSLASGAGGLTGAGMAAAEAAAPAAEVVMTLGEAQGALASEVMFGGLKLGSATGEIGAGSVGAGGILGAVLGGLVGGGLNAAAYGGLRDLDKEDRLHRQKATAGEELAGQAMRAGDLLPVIGKAGGDKEVIAALLERLEAQSERLNETLRTQVAAGIAAELRRAPLIVRPPQDPNRPQSSGSND